MKDTRESMTSRKHGFNVEVDYSGTIRVSVNIFAIVRSSSLEISR